jgi:hypothetical protein
VALAHGVAVQAEQHGVDVADRPRCERPAVGAEQIGVEPVELGGGDLRQRPLPEPGQHVHPQVAPVALDRRRAKLADPDRRQPGLLDVVGQRGLEVGPDVGAGVELGDDGGQRALGVALGGEAAAPDLLAGGGADVGGVDDDGPCAAVGVLADASATAVGVGHEASWPAPAGAAPAVIVTTSVTTGCARSPYIGADLRLLSGGRGIRTHDDASAP